MLIATVVVLAGLLAVAVLSQRRDYRLGGVMVLPLLAIYTFRELFSPVVFVLATGASFAVLWGLREYTLTHGRRLFLASVVVGAVASLIVTFALSSLFPERIDYQHAEIVGSIFPGIAAYNFMRVDPDHRRRDLAATIVTYLLLVALGTVSLVALSGFKTGLPAFLYLPTSDVVSTLSLQPVGEPAARVVPEWLTVALLLLDVALYEFVRARYDLRLAGVILVPLLAVFSVRFGMSAFAYVLGATAVFAIISIVHWVTLLYGRNLLAIGLVSGLLFGVGIGTLTGASAPGIVVFFIGIFTGIGAYNLHRTAPRNRTASIRLSAGLFVIFYVVLLAFVDPPTSAFAHPPNLLYAVAGTVVLGLAGLTVCRLERSIPDGQAFARESVFASADVDGASITDSPLIATEGEQS